MFKAVRVSVMNSAGEERLLEFHHIAKIEWIEECLLLYTGDLLDTIHTIPHVIYWSEREELDWGNNLHNRYAD